MNASHTWTAHQHPGDSPAEDDEPDAADLGTAFGMECSLAPHPLADPKLPAPPSDASPDPLR
jgi:hypothetical protein